MSLVTRSRSGAQQGRFTRRTGEPWSVEEDAIVRAAARDLRAVAARLQRSTHAAIERRRVLRRLNGIRAGDA